MKNDSAGVIRKSTVFATAPCSLGYALAAATEGGVCFIALGDSPEELAKVVAAEVPGALPDKRSGPASTAANAIARYLNEGGRLPDLPVAANGSPFQQIVWKKLRQIPAGKTKSYSAIAGSLGQPSASRAVARACATNPVSVLIPCHRVVRTDGTLGGYRWGLSRKQALLALEARTAGR